MLPDFDHIRGVDRTSAFLRGMGSVLNLSPTMEPFSFHCRNFFIDSDFKAIHQDFLTTGNDLRMAMNEFREKHKCPI